METGFPLGTYEPTYRYPSNPLRIKSITMSHFIVKYFSSWIQILHQLVSMEWDSHYSHSTYNALELIRKAIYMRVNIAMKLQMAARDLVAAVSSAHLPRIDFFM